MKTPLRRHVQPTAGGIAKRMHADATHGGLHQRLHTLLAVLGEPNNGRTPDLLERVATALSTGNPQRMWLTLAVLTGLLPDEPSVRRACRIADLDGPFVSLADILGVGRRSAGDGRLVLHPQVEVVTDTVVLDLHETSRSDDVTGVARVATEIARRWDLSHEVVLVGWSSDGTALRRLAPSEISGKVTGLTKDNHDLPPTILVPWHCTYVLPELLGETNRVGRFQALARYSDNQSVVIGYDCVPLTIGETGTEAKVGTFARYLSAVAHTDRMATVSAAAAVEFRGWRTMLQGAGIDGPEIRPISLPMSPSPLDDGALAFAREHLAVAGLPMVLAVGSHTSGQNQMAVLQAAELLWRRGLEFSLLLVGDTSGSGFEFTSVLQRMQSSGRAVRAIGPLPASGLSAAYATAHCTMYLTLNEGFALPVAESIANGTPVITSDFGSMGELAAAGGAVVVNPRDDHQIANVLERVLTDDDLHATLSRQARERPHRTWDDYADEAWGYLVERLVPTPL
jgi:glycosyltransferase involved in cell wall biosynthesis